MTRRHTLGKNQVSIRVLFSETDYAVLQNLAQEERTDIGSLVRRAVVHYFCRCRHYSHSRQSCGIP